MKVLVCGSRDWSGVVRLRERLAALPADTEILHGAARGADADAERIARELGLATTAYPPSQGLPSPHRYHERNDRMLAQADLVIAFWDGKSRGTASVIRKARDKSIPVEVISA